jgi:hypothetical protein
VLSAISLAPWLVVEWEVLHVASDLSKTSLTNERKCLSSLLIVWLGL